MKFNCKLCGTEFKCPPSGLGAGYCSSQCGNKAKTRHGQCWSTEYVSWRDMKIRCLNPAKKDYPRYGGRGIKVCERWMKFENFIADMGLKPGKGYTIERNDSDGDYEPGNCRWATRTEQSRNRSNVYTAEQDQKIREAIALGYNFPKIAKYVGKPLGSVTARAYSLGLKSGQPIRKITDRPGYGSELPSQDGKSHD